VSGPGTSTDNAIARWNGTGGTAIQNSLVVIDDNGHVSLARTFTYNAEGDDGTGGTTTIDFDDNQHRRYSVNTSPVTLTLDDPPGNKVGHFQLKLYSDSNNTINWAAASGTITWVSGSSPTFSPAGGTRFINFYNDGTNWYAQFTDQF
jgi:hypothetical protein